MQARCLSLVNSIDDDIIAAAAAAVSARSRDITCVG